MVELPSVESSALVKLLLDQVQAEGISRAKLYERLADTARENSERVYSESTLSKVLGGHLAPGPALVRVIAKYVDLDEAEARRLSQKQDTRSARHLSKKVFRVGFGHCVWAAPLVAVALEERPEGYQFVSFGGGRLPLRPHFYPPDAHANVDYYDWKMEQYLGLGSLDDLPNCKTNASGQISYSARDILKLLDRSVIDIALVPWSAAASRPYKRVGTIVDSANGCTLVSPPGVLQFPGNNPGGSEFLDYPPMSTSEFGRRLLEASDKDTTYVVYAEPATVALNYAMSLKEALGPEKQDRLVVRNFSTSDLAASELAQFEKAVGKQGELLGVIAWDPQATWLKRRSRGAVSVPLSITHGKWTPPQHLTFDLIHRGDPVSSTGTVGPNVTAAAKELLRRMRFQAENVRSLHETREPSLLTSLMDYYGFPRDRKGSQPSEAEQEMALRAICTIRFQVYDHAIDS